MPSTSLSMPGLRLGERQRRVVRWAVLLADPMCSPTTPLGAVSMPHFMGGALGFRGRGQHNKAVKERGGQGTQLKPQSSFWRHLSCPSWDLLLR